MPDASRRRLLAPLALVGATAIWGGSFLMGKVALRELSPGATVLWRFLVAALVLLPLVRSAPRPASARDAGLFVLAAFLGVPALFLLQVEGLARTTATKAALLIGALPPMAALAAVALLGERLTGRVVASLVLSCAGLGLVVGLPGAGGSPLGDGLVLASVAVSVAFILLSRPLLARYGAAPTMVWTMLLGALWLVLLVPLREGVPPLPRQPATWAALVGLGVGCTAVAQGWWNVGLNALGAARASLFVNLEPVFGALLGVFLLHEPVGLGLGAGAALVLVAALLAAAEPAAADPETFDRADLVAEAAAAEGGV